jgi:hypothetical protein
LALLLPAAVVVISRRESSESISMLGSLKAAFGAVIFGLVLLVAAFPVLFLNEKWTVERCVR